MGERENDMAKVLQLSAKRAMNVIELGCGCGISGIFLAQTLPNASVCLTDLPEAEEIAQLNLAQMKPAKASSARFEALDWEADFPASVASKRFDVAIVTDCTYNPDSSPALVNTLQKLDQRSSGLLVLVAMKIRHESEDVFWGLMESAGFAISSREEVSLGDNDVGVEETVLICGFRRSML
jgi:trans-aconitate methyltransferase